LGLSQVYGFVRQSGGAVQLDTAPGQGTTLRFYLPCQQGGWEADEAGEAPGALPAGAAGGGTVLLVEDEADARATVAEHLRALGYKVLEAADGPSALRLLRSNLGARLDLLVTDVGLPNGLNGRQVADAAREQRPDIPVLFVTGHAGHALEGQLAPSMTVITKPFALNALVTRVQAMLEGE
jgi:CheY-like chemotaxis protein